MVEGTDSQGTQIAKKMNKLFFDNCIGGTGIHRVNIIVNFLWVYYHETSKYINMTGISTIEYELRMCKSPI